MPGVVEEIHCESDPRRMEGNDGEYGDVKNKQHGKTSI